MRNILPSPPSAFQRFMISVWQCSQFSHKTYQVLYNTVGNIGVYYLLQWAGSFKTSFLPYINILLWEVCRNGERRRNKFEGSSLPVLSSPRFIRIQRGWRSERCSHTSQIQFAWFIPCSALGFLALLSKYITARTQAGEGMWGLCFARTSAPRAGCGFHRCLPAPFSWHWASSPRPHLTHSTPHPPVPSRTDRFCGDLFHGVLKGNVIAASADPREIHERAFGSSFVRNLEKIKPLKWHMTLLSVPALPQMSEASANTAWITDLKKAP